MSQQDLAVRNSRTWELETAGGRAPVAVLGALFALTKVLLVTTVPTMLLKPVEALAWGIVLGVGATVLLGLAANWLAAPRCCGA